MLRSGTCALAGGQGLYFLVTGVWPLAHMESFLAVTGPKTDLWLVQTVGALIAAVGTALLLAALSGRVTWDVALLGALTAAALAAVDITFVTRDVIPPVYLADAVPEVVFVLWWLVGAARAAGPRSG
ncbi:hypothetical protein C1280_20300 [Gemmata obscuriglobus]|uniref:DUF4345 domain-containing protein n=1 Tax=Gemmata obscuriglobus TaxID=114 RepID=A0A2Z3HBJ1_9BACT|nr:hypothetical protein C1280_20300 [Gemmata obscuriglobus]